MLLDIFNYEIRSLLSIFKSNSGESEQVKALETEVEVLETEVIDGLVGVVRKLFL